VRRAVWLAIGGVVMALLPSLSGGDAVAASVASPQVGPLGPKNAVSIDGMLRPALDGTVHGTVPAVDGTQFLVGVIRGTTGRTVQVSLNGELSAPIKLGGVAQRFGVTAPHPATALDAVEVVPVGAWQSSDSLQVSSLSLGTSSVNVTSVQPGTRLILLNGQPFTAKGYVYGNSPIGTPSPFGVDGWAFNPDECQTDAALLGGAGANVVRVFIRFPELAPTTNQTQCLDAFAANGIGVEFDLFPADGMNPGQATFMTEYSAQISKQIPSWSSSPAMLFWELDNEVEQSTPAAAAGWYGTASGGTGQLNTLALQAEALDGNHLVGTGISSGGPGGCLGWIASSNVPALQFWGLHLYVDAHLGTHTCTLNGTTAAEHTQATTATTVPIIVDEFGIDRYWCAPGLDGAWLQFLSPVDVSFTPTYACTVPGSHEDQADQASWLSTAWSDLSPYLASSGSPNNPFSGGLAWEYSDQWWNTEASVFNPIPGTPWTHEIAGVTACCGALSGDAGLTLPEWFSVNDAITPGDNGMRVTTLGFNALEAGWLGTTLPTISGVSTANSAACPVVTVTWTTSTAMTTQLDIGPRVMAAPEGQAPSDSTYYMQAVDDGGLSTSHSVTLSGLIPGQDYQIAVRSFTSAGASVATTPVDVTWMPTVPPGLPLSCPTPNMPPFPQVP
jgi:hypothetical protein